MVGQMLGAWGPQDLTCTPGAVQKSACSRAQACMRSGTKAMSVAAWNCRSYTVFMHWSLILPWEWGQAGARQQGNGEGLLGAGADAESAR